MSLVGHCAMWGKCYLPFLTSSTLELCSFQAITALQALLIVSTLGLLEKGADDKELEGKSTTEMKKKVKVRERLLAFSFSLDFWTWWLLVNQVSLACKHTFCSLQLSSFFVSHTLKIIHTALGERFNLRLVEFFHREEWCLICTCMCVSASEVLCFPILQCSVKSLKARELKSSHL